ncbi:MAG TPA: polysaccharide deacetylase family protein [Rhodocyclaceae bacterium]|nr:polysaccharide deacetylase family protein [Rhodocyclaceae bacterium]
MSLTDRICSSIARRLARDKVTVLLFHKVPVLPDPMAPDETTLAQFEQLLDFLSANYRVIPLQEAIAGLQGGRVPGGSVCITFDDGYADWMDGAATVLRKYDAHATFFLTTGQFDGLPLWHERIRRAIERANGSLAGYGDHLLPLETTLQKQQATRIVEQTLKYLPLQERAQRLAELEAWAGSAPERMPRMSAAQVRELHASGFGIGAHTVDHPILSLCSETEARRELAVAREILEEVVGASVDCLAYPNGRWRDFNPSHVEYARQAGYRSAVMTEGGAINARTSLFHIPRFTPWGTDPLRLSIQISRNIVRNQISNVPFRERKGFSA